MKKVEILFSVFLIVILFVVFASRAKIDKNNFQNTIIEYPFLSKQDSVHGVLESLYHVKGYAIRESNDLVHCQLVGGRKLSIMSEHNSKVVSGAVLANVCKPGARLLKKGDSDTLSVYHENASYKFLIEERDTNDYGFF